ncbi:AraC family transcriptional regulator [Flavitalea sp. BT771]|uniref:helix-turn-helix domain-containing protein n=1 Tax=Flavitalea sp. BT771 TaxID=3063329 RepID=UPI0026E46AB5|nr:AraC family transcriptional regulator [Flavitalea sp. BT771]MDO6429950.1 AraC family transcriptional regulator [Flavitalea sp. BT771]MDV6217922.1 AraC family transcriptional regulator [Flavitalea sp. BT771]
MSRSILKEAPPLTKSDCFSLFARYKTEFDFPVHYHEEYELNFIENAKGVKRIVGDSVEEIEDLELVLIGPNIPHAWFTHKCKTEIFEITIQFHRDLFHEVFLKRTQLSSVRNLFEQSLKGILFSKETIRHLAPRLKELEHKTGFDSVIELMSILNELSLSTGSRCLSGEKIYNADYIYMDSLRMEKLIEFMNAHFSRPIRLAEAADLVNMAETAFSRFFKAKTGVNFVDFLNDIRLGHASRLLIDTKDPITNIAVSCGFTNISNFNRTFKREKGLTPKDFRAKHGNVGERVFF